MRGLKSIIVEALSLGERVARVASRVRGLFPQSLATSEFGLILLCHFLPAPTTQGVRELHRHKTDTEVAARPLLRRRTLGTPQRGAAEALQPGGRNAGRHL